MADLSPIYLSIAVALSATFLSFIAGVFAAYLLYQKKGLTKAIADIVFCLPMVLPPTASGLFLLVFFGRTSFVGKILSTLDLQIVFTPFAAVLAAFLVSFPLMYRAALAAFMQVDKNVIMAGRTLGLGKSTMFFKVLMPLAKHGLLSGLALAFARAMGEFGATIMIAGNIPGKTRTMSMAIYYSYASGNMNAALFYTIILTVISFLLLLFIQIYGERQATKY